MIKFANYKDNNTTRKVTAIQIDTLGGYQETYRNHLFCSEDGCEACIELAHRMGYPYFRTCRGSKHSPDCYYAFEHDPTKVSMRAEETLSTAISSEHKQKALQYSNKKRKEDESGITPTPRSISTPRTNHPHSSRGGVRLIPSVDPNTTNTAKVKREPRIPTRKCEDISTADIGKMINVRGRVNQVSIKDSSVRFFFDTKGHSTVSALFYTRFRESFPQEYGWIKQIAQFINSGYISNLPMSCISICEHNDNRFDVQVFDVPSINLNDKPIAAFMRDFVASNEVAVHGTK